MFNKLHMKAIFLGVKICCMCVWCLTTRVLQFPQFLVSVRNRLLVLCLNITDWCLPPFCLCSVGLAIVKLDRIISVWIVYWKVAEENECVDYYYAAILRPSSLHTNKHFCLTNR